MMILSVSDSCNVGIMSLLSIAKTIINTIQIIGPILCIISLTISFVKLMKSEDDKKIMPKIKNSIIALVLVFFIPLLVNVFMNLAEDTFSFAKCWENIDTFSINSTYSETSKTNKSSIISNPDDYEEGKERTNDNSTTDNTSSNSSISSSSSHQAKDFFELGEKAYQGDKSAAQEWIKQVASIVNNAQHSKYGIKNSLITAQIILESGWMHKPTRYNSDGSSLVGSANNILSVNYDMGKKISSQSSSWSKNPKAINCSVSIYDSSGNIAYEVQKMRAYDSIEQCIEDYADLVYLYHPECKNNNNMSCYKSFITGYTNAAAYTKISNVIKNYNIDQYD